MTNYHKKPIEEYTEDQQYFIEHDVIALCNYSGAEKCIVDCPMFENCWNELEKKLNE